MQNTIQRNNLAYSKIQRIIDQTYTKDGKLKSEKQIRLSFQEIYTIANEMYQQ